MAYRYTLPAQPSPYTCQQRELLLRSQTISNAIASPPGLKRSSLHSERSPYARDKPTRQHPWIDHFGKENVKITAYPVSPKTSLDGENCQYDPADPTTWGVKPLPPLPCDGTPTPQSEMSIMSKADDDDAAMLQSPIMPPCSSGPAASHNLARLIGDHLRIDDEQPTCSTHRRITSSSYHDPESELSRVQSPISSTHVNMLSVTDLTKYGKANDRLSNLRSGSPSSATGDLLLYEPNKMAEPYTFECQISRYRFASSPSEVTSNGQRQGYDGAHEASRSNWASIAPSPPPSINNRSPTRTAKRRASLFSLRSLGGPFSKRTRLGFRKWANSVYLESSRRFQLAKKKLKEHAETERRDFTAWKAQRRRSKQVDAKAGKDETKADIFSKDCEPPKSQD